MTTSYVPDWLAGYGVLPPSAAERNVALILNGTLALATVAAGTMPGSRAAFGAAERIWVMPGPEATLRGLADRVQQEVLSRVSGWTPVPNGDLPRLAAALYRLGRQIETGTAQPLDAAAAGQRWLVGTLFPLPIWRPAGGGSWLVDTAAITAGMAAVSLPAVPLATPGEWQATFSCPARALDQVDPFTSTTAVHGKDLVAHAVSERDRLRALAPATSAPAAASALGAAWGANARWNPYAALFPVLEFATSYSLAAPAARTGLYDAFSAAFYGSFTDAELHQFARTSAGYAIIRCLWRASAGGRTARVATELGTAVTNTDLVGDYPSSAGTDEPPLAAGNQKLQLPNASTPLKSKLPQIAFGRVVPFTVQGYQDRFRGVSFTGEIPPSQIFEPPAGTVAIDLSYVDAAYRSQWQRVLAGIARTEGNTDAATSWDSAVCSLGFQQWSLHDPVNGPALLARFNGVAPIAYDAIIRSSGLDADPGATPGGAGSTVATAISPSKLWALAPAGSTLLKATSGGEAGRAPILRGLGWTKPGKIWLIGEPSLRFIARWAVASRFLPSIWQAMADLAVARIRLVRDSMTGAWAANINLAGMHGMGGLPTLGGADPGILDIFATEAMAASIIDHHINLPGDVWRGIRLALLRAIRAWNGTFAGPPADHSGVSLDDEHALHEFRLKVHAAHQWSRQLNAGGGRVDVAALRVAHLATLWDDAISLNDPFRWS